jgi:hypothetical protein
MKTDHTMCGEWRSTYRYAVMSLQRDFVAILYKNRGYMELRPYNRQIIKTQEMKSLNGNDLQLEIQNNNERQGGQQSRRNTGMNDLELQNATGIPSRRSTTSPCYANSYRPHSFAHN